MRTMGKLEKLWKSGYIQVFALGYFAAMLSFAVLLIRGDGIFTLGKEELESGSSTISRHRPS